MANLDWVSRSWVEDSHWFDGKTVIYASHQGDFAESRVGRFARVDFAEKEQRDVEM